MGTEQQNNRKGIALLPSDYFQLCLWCKNSGRGSFILLPILADSFEKFTVSPQFLKDEINSLVSAWLCGPLARVSPFWFWAWFLVQKLNPKLQSPVIVNIAVELAWASKQLCSLMPFLILALKVRHHFHCVWSPMFQVCSKRQGDLTFVSEECWSMLKRSREEGSYCCAPRCELWFVFASRFPTYCVIGSYVHK